MILISSAHTKHCMSNFNEYNIRQAAQLSKFNPKTEKYENFSIFKDYLELPGLKIPELLIKLQHIGRSIYLII